MTGATPPSGADLVGRWVHLFEEDDDRGEVYRRDAADVPLSRRPRKQIEFRADGSARVLTAGADDRLREHPAAWREASGEVRVDVPGARDGRSSLHVVRRGSDRIVVLR
ncbi:MAG: hypothetical protein HYR74_10215 [Candidatus Eisenbacteria bacterium]|nr:hypothetical protein [Candidatus Eisenbacteria bacterium]